MNHNSSLFSDYSNLNYAKSAKHPIYLMGGKVYDDPDCKEELKLRFGEYLLFTYRYTLGEGAVPNQNNSGKISGKVKHLISDMGWGCMIRCGQMMIGNAIM
jgi:hypothetical protein